MTPEKNRERTNKAPAHRIAKNQVKLKKRPLPQKGYETWLDERQTLLRKVRVVRQSSTTKSMFESNLRASVPGWSDDPAVKTVMEEYGADIVLPERQDLRDKAGVYPVRLRDLPGGDVRTALVAYAIPMGDTLFLYVMNSAAKSILAAAREEDRGNPFTELLRSTVRRLTYRLWDEVSLDARLRLYIPQHTRLVRDKSHAKAAWRTFQWSSTDLIIDGKHINVHNANDEFVHHIFEGTSAKELTEIVTRLFKQKQSILVSGNFYLHPNILPFTHGPNVYERTDGDQTWTEEDPHRLRAHPDAGPKLAELVDFALETAADDPRGTIDWKAVAEYAGVELGLESRLPMHRKRGGKPIHMTSQDGYGAIRTLLKPMYIRGWLTGEIYTDVKVPHGWDEDAVLMFDEDIEVVTDANGIVRYRVPVRFPAPPIDCADVCEPDCAEDCDENVCQVDWHYASDGTHKTSGWPVADHKLEELLELREANSQAPHKNRGGGDKRRPLVGITHNRSFRGYIADGRQYRLSPNSSTVYQVEHRPVPDDPHGQGWDGTYPIYCTLNAAEWHTDAGRALQAALERTDRKLAPLHVPTSARSRADRQSRERAQELKEAEEALDAVKNRITGATEMLADAKGARANPGDDDDPAELEANVNDAEDLLAVARKERAELRARIDILRRRAEADTGIEESAEVHVFDLAVVAVALQKMGDGVQDRIWNDLITTHVRPQSVRFQLDEHGGRVRWKMAFTVQDENGHWFDLPVSGSVHNKVQKCQDGSLNRPAAAGGYFFADCIPFNDVAKKLGTSSTRGNKQSYLWHLLHEFLRQHVPVPALRTALIDSPPEMSALRRTLYAHVTGDRSVAEGIPHAYRRHIIDTYTRTEQELPHSWGWHYVGSTHVHERAILAAITDLNVGISVVDAIRAAGTSRTHVLATGRQHRSIKRSPGRNIPPRLVQTWDRTDRLDDDQRMLVPVECPHEDCPGHRNGRTAFCTIVLWTPETWADAVLCPDCMRTPSNADVVYPDAYRLPWRGRTGPEAKTCGARDADGTHLDPDYVDNRQGRAAA